MTQQYYDENYYAWQRRLGELGADIDLWKFDKYIQKKDMVLDFGCGGGFILSKLKCEKKYGIEINSTAVKEAKRQGITIFNTIDDIPKNLKFDYIISHHALEHITNPYETIEKLGQYLKPKGKMIHVVPIDDWRIQRRYTQKDINQHLYTWNPLLLGNLFVKAGYTIERIDILTHAWLPFSKYFYRILPKFLYFFFCRIWSFITLNRQIRIIVSK